MSLPPVRARLAECAYCKHTTSDRTHAAFWEDRGPGSEWATESCTCGYRRIAHEPVNPHTGRPGITDHKFVERGPAETDRFYCGCRGWD